MLALSKEFLDIQATIECGFTLKCVRDMTRTYNQFVVGNIEGINKTWARWSDVVEVRLLHNASFDT